MLQKITFSQNPLTFIALTITGLFPLSNPAQAVELNFDSWESTGDVVIESSQRMIMTNAYLYGLDDDFVDYNESGEFPVFASEIEAELENELGLTPLILDGLLGFDATDASATIGHITITAQAGEKLRFNWNFLTNHDPTDDLFVDHGFIIIADKSVTDDTVSDPNLIFVDKFIDTTSSLLKEPGGQLTVTSPVFAKQTGFQTYHHTFNNDGDYTVIIGVMDGSFDVVTSSALVVTSTPIPEPMTILGSLVAMGFGVAFKRRVINK